MREAVRLDATLEYEEPWSWMQPPRHALGALLLEQGQVAEAAEVYSADLAAHPGGNCWSLSGLSEVRFGPRLGGRRVFRCVLAMFLG